MGLQELHLTSLTVRDQPALVERTPGCVRLLLARMFPTLEVFNGEPLEPVRPLLATAFNPGPRVARDGLRDVEKDLVDALVGHAVRVDAKLNKLHAEMESVVRDLIREAH